MEIEAAVRAFAEREGVKLGAVAQPMRAALTGSASSPPIFDVMAAWAARKPLPGLQIRSLRSHGNAGLRRLRCTAKRA